MKTLSKSRLLSLGRVSTVTRAIDSGARKEQFVDTLRYLM